MEAKRLRNSAEDSASTLKCPEFKPNLIAHPAHHILAMHECMALFFQQFK